MRNPMRKKTLDDVDVTGKRVLVRVDFNVPLEGTASRTTPASAALPTIRRLIDAQARVVLMSHSGRPDGVVKDDLRLAPVAERLAQLLGRPVATAPDCTGPEAQEAVAASRKATCCCWRTSASTPRRRPTTRVRPPAGQPGGRLRQRRLRHRPPRPRLHRGRGPPPPGGRRRPDGEGALHHGPGPRPAPAPLRRHRGGRRSRTRSAS